MVPHACANLFSLRPAGGPAPQATKEFAAEVAPSIRDARGRTVLRLSMGRLLHTLILNMQGAAAEAAAEAAAANAGGAGAGARTRPLMYLYSGHDSTVMPLLAGGCATQELCMDLQFWSPSRAQPCPARETELVPAIKDTGFPTPLAVRKGATSSVKV